MTKEIARLSEMSSVEVNLELKITLDFTQNIIFASGYSDPNWAIIPFVRIHRMQLQLHREIIS